ncbi:MAG: EpsG family protein [Ruminiclostridium sp.]|nr:EpsG family protein [Ruminiclostridium sp.]
MMFFRIIPICLPALLAGAGHFCSRKEMKAVFCLIFAGAVFCITGCGLFGGYGFAGSEAVTANRLGSIITGLRYNTLSAVSDASPAYLLIMKVCGDITDDPLVFAAVIAALQSILAAAAVGTVCCSPYEGAVMLSGCFLLTTFVHSSTLTAGLICLFASKYIKERRMIRFIVLITAAACFDISALLLIPLYFITMIPNVYICTGVSAAAAVLAALFPDTITAALDTLGGRTYTGYETPVVCAVAICAFALLCIVIRPMLINRSPELGWQVNTAVLGAALTTAAAAAPVLSAPALFVTMQSAVPLAPEVYDTGSRFVGIVFKDSRKTAQLIFGIVCTAIITAICAYLVLENVYGSDAFAAALTGEALQ